MFIEFMDAVSLISILVIVYYLFDLRRIYLRCTEKNIRKFIQPLFTFLFIAIISFILSLSPLPYDISFFLRSLTFITMVVFLWKFNGQIHTFSKEYGFLIKKERIRKKMNLLPVAVMLFFIFISLVLFPLFRNVIDLAIVILSFISFSFMLIASLSEKKTYTSIIYKSIAASLFLALLSNLCRQNALICLGQSNVLLFSFVQYIMYIPIVFAVQVFISEFDGNYPPYLWFVGLLYLFLQMSIQSANPLTEITYLYTFALDLLLLSMGLANIRLFSDKHWIFIGVAFILSLFLDVLKVFDLTHYFVYLLYALVHLSFIYAAYLIIRSKKKPAVYESTSIFVFLTIVPLLLLILCYLLPPFTIAQTTRLWRLAAALTAVSVSIMATIILWLFSLSLRFTRGAFKTFVYFLITSLSSLFLFYLFWMADKVVSWYVPGFEILPLIAVVLGLLSNRYLKKIIF